MRLLKVLAVTTAAACAVLAAPAVAGAATTPAWTVMPSSGGTDVPLVSVSCPETSFCMAIGAADPVSTSFVWNGSSWSPAPGSGFGDYSTVTGVSCTSPTFCLAVGDYLGGYKYGVQTETWAWNGSTWGGGGQIQPSKFSYLNAVKCLSPSDCEAVGDQAARYSGPYHVLAEFATGSTLTQQPVHGSLPHNLSAVACAAAASCEAVGEKVATHWNGTDWVAQKLPAVSGDPRLDGVSCYPGGCTAVGTLVTASSAVETLAEQWKGPGSGWALASPPGSGDVPGADGTWWNAVRCGSAARCTAIGYWSDDAGGSDYPLAQEWNGHAWSQDVTPSPGAGSAALSALSCAPGTDVCTAVGSGQAGSNGVYALRN